MLNDQQALHYTMLHGGSYALNTQRHQTKQLLCAHTINHHHKVCLEHPTSGAYTCLY